MTRNFALAIVVLLAGATPALAQGAQPADSQNGVASFDVSWTQPAQPAGAQAEAPQSGVVLALAGAGGVVRAPKVPAALRSAQRPAALVPLYLSFGVAQFADVLSTRTSLQAGGVETNPAVGAFGSNTGAMLGFKAATTAGTIYAAEKLWKKNRMGAVVLMAVLNGVTAAVAAHNMQVARVSRVR